MQKAAAPKNEVEFCQKSNGAIRISLATSFNNLCDVSNFFLFWNFRGTMDPLEILSPAGSMLVSLTCFRASLEN